MKMDKNRKYHVKIVDTETGKVMVDERVGCFIGVFCVEDGARAACALSGKLKDAFYVALAAENELERIKTAHPELALLLAAKEKLRVSVTTVDLMALENIKRGGGAEPDVPAAE